MVNSRHIHASTRYVFNASSLINLENLKELRLLDRLGDRVIVPKRVAREVNKHGKPLETWLRKNRRSIVDFLPDEGHSYLLLLQQRNPRIHDGEAAAIAVALHRQCTLVIDDETPMNKARDHGAHCLTTDEFLQLLLF